MSGHRILEPHTTHVSPREPEGPLATSNSSMFSSVVRAGRTTYFVDVKEAKNGGKYLSISESRIDNDDKRQRTTLRVFGESVEPFRQAIAEAAAAVTQ